MADESPKPVALRMRLGFDTADAFEQGYRRFVTAQGIFLASRTPREPGTSLRFELQTRDGGARLLVAEGRVVGVRPADPDHPKRVPGMHVRFTRLTEESRLRIQRMTSAAAAATGPTHTQPGLDATGAAAASAAPPSVQPPAPEDGALPDTAAADDALASDSLRAPTPAPVAIDQGLQAELRQISPPTRDGDDDPSTSPAAPAGSPRDRLRELDLPDPDASPFKNVFDKLFGMGGGAPPDEDPFDLFLQADLPTADGEPLEEVPELPPDAILR